ncbi:TatD family hydrolase [Mesorhizobium sp. WSM2239]|uniref:TatD family hydrolase n=2 Tax=unclassified Mesorhizobium TaxID=325217 RepID=A0AAU8D611_9HYPH
MAFFGAVGSIIRRSAASEGKILSVHSVRTASGVLDLAEECLPRDRGKVVLHWFSGTRRSSARGAGRLLFLGEPGDATKSRGREIVAQLPIDRILTETDEPFVDVVGAPITRAGCCRQLKLLPPFSNSRSLIWPTGLFGAG